MTDETTKAFALFRSIVPKGFTAKSFEEKEFAISGYGVDVFKGDEKRMTYAVFLRGSKLTVCIEGDYSEETPLTCDAHVDNHRDMKVMRKWVKEWLG
jgi:hypothetical protein